MRLKSKMATSRRHVKNRERMKRLNKMRRESRKEPRLLENQKWKPLEVDMSAFADEEMAGFGTMEVLTDYDPNLLKKYARGTGVKVLKKEKREDGISSRESVIEKKLKVSKMKEKKSNQQIGQSSGNINTQADEKMKDQKEKRIKSNTPATKSRVDMKSGVAAKKSRPNKESKNERNSEEQNIPAAEEKNVVESKNQQKSRNKMKRTKQPVGENHNMATVVNISSKSDKIETNPEKRKIMKRKSGKEQLQELRAKRKRRKSELAEEQKIEVKTDEEHRKNLPVEKVDSTTGITDTRVAMSTWDTLSIPTVVHQSLQTMGFTRPTPIQAGCIPAAINEGKDIVGAAETGSGKTLAFGIPLIYRILQHRIAVASNQTSKTKTNTIEERNHSKEDGKLYSREDKEDGKPVGDDEKDVEDSWIVSSKTNDDEENEMDEDDIDDINGDDGVDSNDDDGEDIDDNVDGDAKPSNIQKLKSEMKCVNVVDDISDEAWLKAGLPLSNTMAGGVIHENKLFGLVLTPTRELAVQVKNHLVAAAKMTDIKIAVVVGGMSAEKQKRVLKKHPDVIVGTPGRLWELYQLGEPHLASLPDIKCLIIDEADRMVEKGHYAELSEILDLLNRSEGKSSRQTFVFSATLSLIHLGPLRKSLKKAYKQDKKDKLDSVMAKVGVREDAHVVDLTKKEGTASTLLESKIVCAVEEKDIYLFYFLSQYPGRTLVFTNSIDCIRRLVSVLTLLECKPFPLHSSMHQKQRLKNLERFTENPKGLLLATDVAARGLDIPDIEHVIHYQVPRTSETYVHRSGRTARQAKAGLSVTLVSPNEMNFYRRLCKTLDREEIPSFPVEHSYYQAVKERVDLARDIDKLEHVNAKKKHQNDWFVRAAKELDVDVDEHMNLHDMGDSLEQKHFNKKMKRMKALLKALLRKRIFAAGSSQLYLTSHGKLLSPFSQAATGSHEAFLKMKARMKKDKEDDSKEKDRKRKRFKRMGRYQKTK